jgi:hypothetical protein
MWLGSQRFLGHSSLDTTSSIVIRRLSTSHACGATYSKQLYRLSYFNRKMVFRSYHVLLQAHTFHRYCYNALEGFVGCGDEVHVHCGSHNNFPLVAYVTFPSGAE